MENLNQPISNPLNNKKKVVIKKIGVMSMAKIHAIVLAVLGLIIGVFIGLLGSLFGAAMGGAFPAGMGMAAIVVMPLSYGLIGFVFGAIGAGVYNIVAGWVGGLEITVDDVKGADEYQF